MSCRSLVESLFGIGSNSLKLTGSQSAGVGMLEEVVFALSTSFSSSNDMLRLVSMCSSQLSVCVSDASEVSLSASFHSICFPESALVSRCRFVLGQYEEAY